MADPCAKDHDLPAGIHAYNTQKNVLREVVRLGFI